MHTIPGRLDMTALAALAGTDTSDAARMRHFHTLDRSRQAEAIRRLAATGMSDHGISHATQLSLEQVRRILGEHTASTVSAPCTNG